MELRRVLRVLIVRRILADEPQIEVVGESDSLAEAVGLMSSWPPMCWCSPPVRT
jgi:hypothetical protein